MTTLAAPCDILNGLKYFTVQCNEINGSTNLCSDEASAQGNEYQRSTTTNILGLMGIKSFVFIGGMQYHDGNNFSSKELIETSYFNSLTFSLSRNNKPVGEVFVELLLA